MLNNPAHSFMAPKSMSSEVENIEIKAKKKNTDKLNLSGQTARQPISHELLTIYKHPDKRAGQIQFVRVSILTFLRSYTTLMQLSSLTSQEAK